MDAFSGVGMVSDLTLYLINISSASSVVNLLYYNYMKHTPKTDTIEKMFSIFDIALIVVIVPFLISSFLPTTYNLPYFSIILAIFSFLGLIPVVVSAGKSLLNKKLSVDLLATIALAFSLISYQWVSAAFITLMLAFARLFDRITEARAKKTIQSLMKYNVERVRIKTGDSIKEVHINDVQIGDLVVVEAGDRMPVDGVVVSGEADVNEASLTGESDMVHKKVGSHVFWGRSQYESGQKLADGTD